MESRNRGTARSRPRLHAERTRDPDTIRFIVRAVGWSIDGRWTAGSLCGCPSLFAEMLEAGRLDAMEIRGEQTLLTRRPSGEQWATLAPDCRSAIVEELENVDDLARAHNVVARGTGAVALSHGGNLRIVSLTDDAVQVAMDGACHGCPAADRTLRDGVLKDLQHAGIDVKNLAVQRIDSATDSGRK